MKLWPIRDILDKVTWFQKAGGLKLIRESKTPGQIAARVHQGAASNELGSRFSPNTSVHEHEHKKRGHTTLLTSTTRLNRQYPAKYTSGKTPRRSPIALATWSVTHAPPLRCRILCRGSFLAAFAADRDEFAIKRQEVYNSPRSQPLP